MKKFLCLLSAVALMMLAASCALALEAKPGETFNATFTVTDNSNKAVAATVELEYDHSVLSMVSSDDFQNDSAGLMDISGIQKGTSKTATFKVSDSAKAGTYTIIASVADAMDIDENSVSGFAVSSVSVTVAGCAHEKTTEKETKKATCEEAGEKQFVCDNCGEVVKTETIPALGHKWDAGKVTKEPTETEAGERTYTCQNDATHTKIESIPALGPCAHEKTTEKVTKKATCEEAGEKQIVCDKCGEVVKTETLPALGHSYQWKTVKEPTTTAEGLRQYVCSRCGKVDQEEKLPVVSSLILHNNTICSEGIRFRDIKPTLTQKWFMFTPIDLSQNGVQEVRLIIANCRYAGTATVRVQDGKVTVTYKLNQFVKGGDMAFTFLHDLDSTTDVEMKRLSSYNFGQPISIEEDLNGDTRVLLYILGYGDYDFMEELMDWFDPDSPAYRRTVNQLKDFMD